MVRHFDDTIAIRGIRLSSESLNSLFLSPFGSEPRETPA